MHSPGIFQVLVMMLWTKDSLAPGGSIYSWGSKLGIDMISFILVGSKE